MNLSEFKAWFEGFSEGIDDAPSKKQWKRINEKVMSITSDPTPWPIFFDRYIGPRWSQWEPCYNNWGTAADTYTLMNGGGSGGIQFSDTAFTELGRIEAQETAANA